MALVYNVTDRFQDTESEKEEIWISGSCFYPFSRGCPKHAQHIQRDATEEQECVCVCVCGGPELIPSEGSIVVVAGMRIAGDSFSPALGLTPLSGPSVANGLLLQ